MGCAAERISCETDGITEPGRECFELGPNASLSLREGDLVSVHAQVELPSSQGCLVRVPIDLKGGHRKIEVPYAHLFLTDYSTNAAYEAVRVLLQRLDQANEIAARVQAEIYELGILSGDNKRGLVL